MRCLVSLCNKDPAGRFRLPGVFLFDIDLDRGAVRPVRLDHPRSRAAIGVNGLAHCQDGILLVPQNAQQLVRLDATLAVSDVWDTPAVTGGHSIAVHGARAHVVCARTDSIVEFDRDLGARLFWRANPGGADTLHLNSAVWVDDTLYVSAFGPKADPTGLWSSATQGYIVDVGTGRRIVEPIHHPHSLVHRAGQLYWCESATMAVCNQAGQRLDVGRGYVRGLIVDDEHVVVGLSKGRNLSVSTGRRILASVFRRAECGILVYRHDPVQLGHSTLVAEISLAEYGDEIYDLLPLDPSPR